MYSSGWRHQFVAGTLHSAVISRDENKIKDLLLRDDGAIDTIDDDGYSALHYACMYRCPNAVRLLRGAGADVTTRDNRGFTPLHWAALQLDHEAIDILCEGCKGEDVDYLDNQQRTPLFLACVEGRSSAGGGGYSGGGGRDSHSGHTDPKALALCVSTLLQYDADANVTLEGNNNHYNLLLSLDISQNLSLIVTLIIPLSFVFTCSV